MLRTSCDGRELRGRGGRAKAGRKRAAVSARSIRTRKKRRIAYRMFQVRSSSLQSSENRERKEEGGQGSGREREDAGGQQLAGEGDAGREGSNRRRPKQNFTQVRLALSALQSKPSCTYSPVSRVPDPRRLPSRPHPLPFFVRPSSIAIFLHLPPREPSPLLSLLHPSPRFPA